MNDLVIKGGWIVDGTGRERRRGDLCVSKGRIVEICEAGDGEGNQVIDADDMVVAPGFVDIHTHYDAQFTWDPAASPSSLHGVTTVIGGNCGFSLAPITPDAAEYLVPMLAKVEGMPEASLRAGLKVSWESFGEFLDSLEGNLSVNAGFMVGHSALRRVVMGDAAVGSAADDVAIEEMTRLMHESIDAGAIGFSTSRGQAHLDHNADPVPSRHASIAEILALSRAAGQHPGTSLEAIPTVDKVFDREAQMFLVAMSLAAARPVNWNAISLEQDLIARESRLEPSVAARAAGGKVIALAPAQPAESRFSLAEPFLWESIPGWADTMHLPFAARRSAFNDPHVRAALRAGAGRVSQKWVDWPGYTISDVATPALAGLVGRTVGEIAAERNCDPFDAFCDIAVQDNLRTGWVARMYGDDDQGWKDLVELCRNRNVVVGASDAGAHVDIISSFSMYSGFLGSAVRARGLLPIEEAIAMLSAAPADLYGLKGRGRLTVGSAADIVIFDENAIGRGPTEMRHDLPAGAGRIYCEPLGIQKVLVSGTVIVQDSELTGATPGNVLRSGRDTSTPQLN